MEGKYRSERLSNRNKGGKMKLFKKVIEAQCGKEKAKTDLVIIHGLFEDIVELLDDLQSTSAVVLGHSMGGRVAMRFALLYQNRVEKLIVADMSMRPPKLRPEHWMIFQTMKDAPLENMKSYTEIEEYLSKQIANQQISNEFL